RRGGGFAAARPTSGFAAARRRPKRTSGRAGRGTALVATAVAVAVSGVEPGRVRLEVVRLDHPVDQPVLTRLLRLEEFVAFHVERDLVDRLAGVFDVDLVQPVA